MLGTRLAYDLQHANTPRLRRDHAGKIELQLCFNAAAKQQGCILMLGPLCEDESIAYKLREARCGSVIRSVRALFLARHRQPYCTLVEDHALDLTREKSSKRRDCYVT